MHTKLTSKQHIIYGNRPYAISSVSTKAKTLHLAFSNLFTMLKPSHLVFSSLFSIVILGLLTITTITSISPASASPVDFSVSVAPSLNVTIPTNIISLNLNPINNAFSTSDLTVSVGTNNPSGYTLTMTSSSTDLTRTEKVGDTYPVISTLTSETTESNFTTNRWGYRFNDNTANTNYQPFTTNILVKEYDKAVNNDTRTITFASKIDTTQAPGTYELALNFTAVANPNLSTMQNLADAQCPTTPTEVIDSRDGTVYTIQRLADGNCWMLDNLALDLSKDSVKTNLTSATTNAPDANLTSLKNNVVAKTADGGSWTNSYTAPYIATSGTENGGWDADTVASTKYGSGSGKIGIYYNYCAASANTICSDSNSSNASYDICPVGWKLPAGDTGSGSFYYLYNTGYSSNVANFQAALSTPLSGNVYGGSANDQGSRGKWWSSTRISSTSMCGLYVDASNVYPQSDYSRNYGYSIRCILN